jgi:hypothetical protein
MDEGREEFLLRDSDILHDEMGEPVGTVAIHASETSTCWTEWGGWGWQAKGPSREVAQRRLEARLMHLNPFDGADTDWGEPGSQVGPLDPRIPKTVRQRMREVSRERGDIIPDDVDDESLSS